MKDWKEYYTKIKKPTSYDRLQELRNAVDKLPLTVVERDKKYEEAELYAENETRMAMDVYLADVARLREMFWKDCREHLGYDKFLSPKSVDLIEKDAWEVWDEDNGYDRVFYHLGAQAELVIEIVSDTAKEIFKHMPVPESNDPVPFQHYNDRSRK